MAARWQEGCGEGEGGLGRWAGEAASRWRGEQVTARPGCPGTGCSCLHQLPLRAWCHDLSPCADVSVCPARLSPFPIAKFMAPVSQGAWSAGALLVRVGAKSSLLLLARERCQRCQPGAPCGFVPSYWCGAAPRRCQGQPERRAGTQGGAAFLPAPPEPAFWACRAWVFPVPTLARDCCWGRHCAGNWCGCFGVGVPWFHVWVCHGGGGGAACKGVMGGDLHWQLRLPGWDGLGELPRSLGSISSSAFTWQLQL